MNYKQVAQDCLRLVGGKENVNTAAHCATRLRLQLVDKSKADIEAIKALPDVIGVKEMGEQTQIIIGPSVSEVYKQLTALIGGDKKAPIKVAYEKPKRGALVSKLMDVVSGVFGPIIPVIAGAGMIKAILSILVLVGLPNTSNEYYMLNFIADAAFYFLPVLLGFSCGNKFGCNPYLAAAVGATFIHPNWNALVSAGNPVAFLGIPVTLNSYASTVVPIILTVWFMSYVEKFADKYSPSMVKAILKPLVTFAVSALVGFIVIAPLGSFVGKLLAGVVSFLDANFSLLLYTIIGAVWPLLVFAGMHMAIFPPIQLAQMADMGYETVAGPSVLAANIAVGASCLAAALRAKNRQTRELGISAGVTALCGITEPALYGFVFKFKRPLIATMIGGACGGLFAGITHLKRYAFATPSLPSLGIFIGEDPMNIVYALITAAIGFAVAFVVAWFLGIEESETE